MCNLQTLEAVMSLKNKTVPFQFLSEPRGGADIAHFAMSETSENRRHAKRQHVCATPGLQRRSKIPIFDGDCSFRRASGAGSI
jgi:hypothetical protein